MELIPCPYPGSRSSAAKPINVSALRETIKHWRPALALLARVRGEVPAATAMDIWWAGQLAESLPYLTLFRHGGRPEGVIVPGPVAAAYKAMLGTNAGLLGFVLDLPPSPAPGLPDVDEVLAHVEEHRLLVGPEQACAGPESLIRETLSVLIHGGPRNDEADRLFDSHPDAVAFGQARASLLVTRMAFGLSTHAIFADLAQGGVPRELGEAIARVGAGEPTRDQERFSRSSHTDRLARLRGLARRAVAGEEFLRAAERVLAPDFAGGQPALDSLGRAVARQELLEEACRSWIAGIKRHITQILPDDAQRDRELALSTVNLPAQTPLRRLMTILTDPPRGAFA